MNDRATSRVSSRIERATFDLPEYQPFAGLEERITTAAKLTEDDRQWLTQHGGTLRRRYEQLAVDHTDFNRLGNDDYHAFVAAYGGYDMTTTPEFRIYADIRELRWTAFAISLSHHSPTAEAETAHRIACLRGRIPKPWQWNAL